MTTSTSAPDPRRWAALFLLCTAQFLVILDTSIVGIALPALQRALGFDAAGLQWIFNAYVVAFGGLLLLGGRLADLFGPRRLFAIGFGVPPGPRTREARRAVSCVGAPSARSASAPASPSASTAGPAPPARSSAPA